RGGVLEGFPGLFVAATGAFYVFLRWAKVRERRARDGADAASPCAGPPLQAKGPVRNALTIDVEEYFQAHAYAKVIDRADWERIPGRVGANVRRLLALLAGRGTRATFFVLGWVADRHPEVVREIAAAGHEVGSHGYAHQL